MNHLIKSKAIPIGFAMFSMFFGAGNIIYPLALGQYAGDKNLFAMTGLLITAAIMPIAGAVAMILFEGNYRRFFGRMGSIPGFLLALTIISLLGPLGSTPRCIALAYATLNSSLVELSPMWFSAFSCALIFLFTVKRKHILAILGWVLTPLLLISLIAIIAIGLISAPEPHTVEGSPAGLFLHGLSEGYKTMDLLAAFFFSSTILAILKDKIGNGDKLQGPYFTTALQASAVAVCLLSSIYIGFSYIASFHGSTLGGAAEEELLAAVTMKLAGPYAGILVCIAVALACLTTAIALITAFTDFVQSEVFEGKISYEAMLITALLLTFFVSTFEFTAISAFLWPILKVFYPALIVLTMLNIANRLTGFEPIKTPVYLVFGTTLIVHLMSV